MTLATHSFSLAVNHLLAKEAWAREQLAPYAGKTARLAMPPLTFDLRVRDDGLLEALPVLHETAVHGDMPPAASSASSAVVFNVTITATAAAVSAFVQGGQAAALKHVKIDGDAEFAATIARLSEHLRWEPEEDLAGLIGDAPAYQLARQARRAVAGLQRSGRNLLESVVDYFLEEDPQWVRRAQLSQISDEIATLRDALARLEKRMDRLNRRVDSGRADSAQRSPSIDGAAINGGGDDGTASSSRSS
jgi:ubiquinone biosynthesis protein UbiJ